ncbi:hypothetical protein [Synechococcus lacustris]|nr:hypothetical protein [Synechococcus lacustris]MCP9814801.1 hypothetical protein [Synechococcus lacustris L1E-Slac]
MPLLQVLFMPYQVLVDLMPSGPPRDATNASIALMLSKSNLLVRILVELNSAGKCVLLCSSSEGMGNRAPLTTAVLEQLLASLKKQLPELSLSYRSDLDGPIRKPSSST